MSDSSSRLIAPWSGETRALGAAATSFTMRAVSDTTIDLRLARFTPAASTRNNKHAILLIHGLSEHLGRWAGRAESLANRLNSDVWCFDHRGHGLSGGARTHCQSSADLICDAAHVLARIDAEFYDVDSVKWTLFGHSLGGLVATALAERVASAAAWPNVASNVQLPRVTSVVLSAPALATDQAWVLQKLAPMLAFLAPTFRLSPSIRGEQLAHDPAVGQAYFADKLVADTLAITASFGNSLLALMPLVRAKLDVLAKSELAVMVYHGEDDTLVPIAASELIARAVPAATFVRLPKTRHEAQFEACAEEIMTKVVEFIQSHQ